MSHYAVSVIKIQNPDMELLKQALENLAKKLGGRVRENAVVRGWSIERKVPLLLEMQLPYGNGYGVEVTGNGIRIHVDDHGAPLTAEQFANELMTEYTKAALVETLQEMGYSFEVKEEQDRVVITAVEGLGW